VSLYECQDCNPKQLVKDATQHAIETHHTNFILTQLKIDGGEGKAPPIPPILGQANSPAQQVPPSPEPTLASRLAPLARPIVPIEGLLCIECGRQMTTSTMIDPETGQPYANCEEHGDYKQEYVREDLSHHGGKPKREYSPSSKSWASWRYTGHMTRSQKMGAVVMLSGSLLLVLLIYALLFLHWRMPF
jgi:hypothetical protein